MVQVKDFQRACVGGQGFDPCLLHVIFLNNPLQIPSYHSKRAHCMPQDHHPWTNQRPDLMLSMKLLMVDTPGTITLDLTLPWANRIGLRQKFSNTTLNLGSYPLRPISFLFDFTIYFI